MSLGSKIVHIRQPNYLNSCLIETERSIKMSYTLKSHKDRKNERIARAVHYQNLLYYMQATTS